MRRGKGERLGAARLNNLLCEDSGGSLVQGVATLIQSTASSLSASSPSKVSISGAANSVNPRTRANATMCNFRVKIAPSQLEKRDVILLQFLYEVDDEKVPMWRSVSSQRVLMSGQTFSSLADAVPNRRSEGIR